MAKILIIEDDDVIGRELRTRLSRENHSVDLSATADDGLYRLSNYDYDIAIVDWNLPDMEGVDICRRVRVSKPQLPLLMLTARGSIGDKIEGLDSGAMDYMVKPCNLTELLARIRALLRRTEDKSSSLLNFSDLQLDVNSREAIFNGEMQKLSASEFDILHVLIKGFPDPMSIEAIAAALGREADASMQNSTKQLILKIRRKMESAKTSAQIECSRGVGYYVVE